MRSLIGPLFRFSSLNEHGSQLASTNERRNRRGSTRTLNQLLSWCKIKLFYSRTISPRLIHVKDDDRPQCQFICRVGLNRTFADSEENRTSERSILS